ncbi:MAG: beta-N-acetylhexosaminidase, partial [Myxococcota bacterium]
MRKRLPRISDLPLEARIAQLFVVGFEGTDVPRSLRSLLEERGFGGVILFARNVKSAPQLKRLCGRIAALDTALPPIISVDQEGGPVMRLRVPPFTPWPAAGDVARYARRTGDTGTLRRLGQAMGRELAAVGIHWNFAPVLDVNTNLRNPVIGVRAFGTRPIDAGRLALAVERGLRSAGILSTGKHFPGHGDTIDDSHVSLPRVKRSARSLSRIELAPFRAAVRARIPALMTAHVLYPAWDRKLPATFSPAILQGILRKRLGFRGAIVTDDLSMAGARRGQTIEEASFLALRAGADVLLICHDPGAQRRAHRYLVDRAKRGDLSEKRINDALKRMIALKRRYVCGRGGERRPLLSRVG